MGHTQACHARMGDLLKTGDLRDRQRVERAESRLAEAVLKAAQQEIKRVGEQADKEVEKALKVVQDRRQEEVASGPASAEEGIDMEDTTSLYGQTPTTSAASASTDPLPRPAGQPQALQPSTPSVPLAVLLINVT